MLFCLIHHHTNFYYNRSAFAKSGAKVRNKCDISIINIELFAKKYLNSCLIEEK